MNDAFASDNTAPATPEVVAAIAAANTGHVLSYGADPWTDQLRADLARAFEWDGPLGMVPILSGKLANHLALAAITDPGGLIFCHQHSHICIDEWGGPAYVTRCELIGLPGACDKIAPDTLRAAIAERSPLPPGSAFSLTNITEAGCVYTLDEIRALTAIAHEHGLPVHLDGARMSNAAVTLDCSLADMTWRSGVDILSLGATKNGGLGAEAVVAFGEAHATKLRARQELLCHIPSKMRFLSAQLSAWLANDGWRHRAAHANAMTQRLLQGLRAIPGYELVQPVQGNMILVAATDEARARVADAGYYVYGMTMFGDDVIRFVCNWATTEASIDQLLAELAGR